MPQYNNIYTINWSRLIALLLPNDLRKVKLLNYLIALITPLKEDYNEFLQFRATQLYDAEINGQTIKLERVLNDTFDPIDRRIYITDGEYYEPPTFYEEWKNKPVIFLYEGHDDNPTFYSINNIDNRVSFNFFVHVPSEVWHDRTRLRALVDKYKAFGRTFEVVLIE